MLNEGQDRLCQLGSRIHFDDYVQAEIYKAMRSVDPYFCQILPLRNALKLAKDMFDANGIELPRTIEVIDRALSPYVEG